MTEAGEALLGTRHLRKDLNEVIGDPLLSKDEQWVIYYSS